MKLLYTTGFGSKFRQMAQLCINSVEKYLGDVRMVVFCDKDDFTHSENVTIHVIEKSLTVYEMLDFRKNVEDYYNLEKFEQVWYCDVDIIFKRNPFNLFDNSEVKVCCEPWTTLLRLPQWFARTINIKGIEEEPGINGGFFMIPKGKYHFYELYKKEIARLPNDLSADQHALNAVYYNKLIECSLMPLEVECFDARMDFNNHYIIHFVGRTNDNKLKAMQDES